MLFVALLSCAQPQADTPIPTETEISSPSEDDLSAHVQHGIDLANTSYQEGNVGYMSIGELPPEDYIHRPSGLPMLSAGCEWSEENAAYVDAFNEQMATLLAQRPALPPTMVITWTHVGSVSHRTPGPASPPLMVATITHDAISINGTEAHSLLRDRLKIGLLTQNVVENPLGTLNDSYSHTLVLENGDQRAEVLWKQGAATLPEALVTALSAIAP